MLEVIRAHKGAVSNTPVIMLTAKAQKDDVVRGLNMGASDYILKPYKFKDLLESGVYRDPGDDWQYPGAGGFD